MGQISIRELRRKFLEISIPPAIGKNTEHVATMSAILEWAGEPHTPFLDYLLLRLIRSELLSEAAQLEVVSSSIIPSIPVASGML